MPLSMSEEELTVFNSPDFHGDNVYDWRYRGGTPNFTRLPHCMHFYYMGFNDVGLPDIRHYFHDNGDDAIQYTAVPALMENLARNAVFKDHVPPKHGVDFKDIVWRRRSYIAFVMDSSSFRFWENAGLLFVPKNNGEPNVSFYDADDLEIDVPLAIGGTVKRTAFFCINHMKRDSAGNDLNAADRKFYSFELVFRWGTLPDPLKYDPGGTNQGPPEQP